MSQNAASLIDRAKSFADKRNDASITDADWLYLINIGQEDLYRLITSLDPSAWFQSIDFTLAGGALGSSFNLDSYFEVRLVATSLPSFIVGGPNGPGHTLTGAANGALTVDGVAVVNGDRILWPSVSPTSGGIYTQTQLGTGGAPFILTRATDFDQALPTEMQVGAVVVATAGTSNLNSPWVMTAFGGTVDVSAQAWTNLPLYTRYRALHGLDVSPDTNQRRTVGRRMFRERNMGRVGWWWPTLWASDRRYDLRDRMLVITPYETAAGIYRAYYRGAPYKWSSPTDTDRMDPQLEVYDEWVVIKAAMKALKIEESDSSPWREELDLLRDSIISEHTRDDGEPAVLADVEDGGSWVP